MRQRAKTAGVGAAIAAGVLFAVPPPAPAAEVAVNDALNPSLNTSRLELSAASGESNRVTISPMGDAIEVVDLGAPLTAGAGCSGGGSPGEAARCNLHPISSGKETGCRHDCLQPVPGTSWADAIDIDLGDGNDSLEASALQGPSWAAVPITVIGGPGADSITTGSGNDVIYPGDGNDTVHSGPGRDRIVSGPSADGDDLYDMGGENADVIDEVDYSSRESSIVLSDNLVEGLNEKDQLIGVEYVIGTSGSDFLWASPDQRLLSGGPGDDRLEDGADGGVLFGGPGDDTLNGGAGPDLMFGGDGNDRYSGGEGNDQIADLEPRLESEGLPMTSGGKPSTGEDVAEGGTGDDSIELGPGDDIAEGDWGDDELVGGSGADILDGNRGNDTIAGDAGADDLHGGAGADHILAGHVEDLLYPDESAATIEDSWRDTVNCGHGDDRATINPWDAAGGCERTSVVHAFQSRGITHEADGSADIGVEVFSAGRLSLVGVGGDRIDRVSRRATEGTSYLTVRARGRTFTALRRHGQVEVEVAVGFRPLDGIERSELVSLKLVLPRR